MIVNRDLKYAIDIHASVDIIDTTKLNEFMTCPRSFFYNYVLGITQQSNHLVFGKAWHEALEHMLVNGYDKTRDAFRKFLDEYRKEYAADEFDDYAPKTPERAAKGLLCYAQHYVNDKSEMQVHEANGVLMTECAGSVALSEEHELYFRMDAIMDNLRTGQIFAQEHKTGSSAYMWTNQWDLAMQVYTYLYVLYCHFETSQVEGVQINGVIFKKTKDNAKTDAKDGIERHFDFIRSMQYRTPQQLEAWMWRTAYYMDMMKWHFELLSECDPNDKVMKCFPMVTTACTKYAGCPYKEFCMTQDNPLKSYLKYGIPLGWEQVFWDPTEGEIKTNMGKVTL